MNRNGEQNRAGGGARSLAGSHWEWVAGIVGLLLVSAAIGYLLLDATRAQDSAPHIVVRVDTIIAQPGGFLVQFEARNLGGRTAASVRVEGTLESGEAGMERSEVTIDYVPRESSRRGGLLFSADPRAHPLRLRVTGFQRP